MSYLTELRQAMQSFGNTVQDLGKTAALIKANRAVGEIKNSMLSDEEKTQQIRELSTQLTGNLLAADVPVEKIKLFTAQLAPEPALLQTFDQQLIRAQQTRDQGMEKQAKENIQFRADLDLREKQAASTSDPLKAFYKQAEGQAKFQKILDPYDKVRSDFGRLQQRTTQAAQIRALAGPTTSVEELNQWNPQFVREAASALAGMLSPGQVTLEQIEQLYPRTRGMDYAKAKQYISNNPEPANAGKFIELYLKTVGREAAVSKALLEREVLAKATGAAKLGNIDSIATKNYISKLLEIDPEEVIVTPSEITTVRAQKEKDYLQKLRRGYTAAQQMIKVPAEAPIAKAYFKKYNLNPKMSRKEADAELRFQALLYADQDGQ